jgi:hypothetical protein
VKKRVIKKRESLAVGSDAFLGWLTDLHACLMETILDPEPQVEYVVQQFKRKVTRRGNRRLYKDVRITRLREYVKLAMGNAYGLECRR